MKQILKTVAVIALGACAASCAKEQTAALLGGETEVSFTVSAPVIQTRAEIADGTTVDKVACCVYDSNGNLIENGITQTIDMSDKKATFKTRLVTGQTYSFLFWAYKASVDEGWTSPYTFSAADKTVTVSYDNAASNDENRDAFYKYIASMKIEGTVNETVELTRPFAQLNFGVEIEDIVAAKAVDAGITVSKSKVKLTGLANKFNFVTGEATVDGEGDGVTAEFTLADLPAGALPTEVSTTGEYTSGILTVNNKKYGYVAMNYVLPNGNADAELTVAKSADDSGIIKTLEVTNVPLQANYRTNVLGNLFTSQVINIITVNPAFEDDIVKIIEVADVAAANTAIEANKDSEVIDVKFVSEPSDATSKAILTTPVKENGTLNVEIASSTGTLYVGDYTSDAVSAAMTTSTDANAATVNITIPEGVTVTTFVINAPTKTVNINGVNASTYTGTQITTLTATTSNSTLVIEEGQTIDKLIFHQGGLEIHGTVKAVEIQKTGDILVRACENLSNDVYTALKEYIDTNSGYIGIQNDDSTWNIVAPIEMNGVKYATLQDAVNAAGTEETTITLLYDMEITKSVNYGGHDTGVLIDGKKIILNTNGYTITPTDDIRAIAIDNEGELTVNGGGKFIGESSTGDNGSTLNLYSGKLTVGDVYLERSNSSVAVTGGKAVINDATVKAINGGCCVYCSYDGVIDVYGMNFTCGGDDPDGPGSCWAKDGGVINIYGGEFEAAPLNNKTHALEVAQANYCLFDYREYSSYYTPGKVIVYGGKFKDFNPAKNFAGNSYVADGYQSVQDGDYWVVSKTAE